MSTPLTAKPFPEPVDPRDQNVFYVFVNQGAPDATPAPVLLLGEGIASYSLTLSAEAVAMGLQIVADGPRAPTLVGNMLTVWHAIAPDMQAAAAFAGSGVIVSVLVQVVTTADPSRTENHSYLVRIAIG